MRERVRRDWAAIIEEARRTAEEYRERYGVALTLRGIFYILVSKGLISNTRSDYNYLSYVLSKKRYAGEFEWELIEDRTRRVEEYLYLRTKIPDLDLDKLWEELLREMKKKIEIMTEVRINPWDDQKHRVIVVLEKDALFPLVDRLVRSTTRKLVGGEEWELPAGVEEIRVIRGYDSATDVNRLAEKMRSFPEDITPVVLILGDFDPSGEDIPRDFRHRLIMLSQRYDTIFEKVAVTLDQIMELDLPAAPESYEELEKMRRDPRYKRYVEMLEKLAERDQRYRKLLDKYRTPEGVPAIRVELDALAALKPEYLEKVLAQSIGKYFDEKVYREKTKPRVEELRRKAQEIREVLREEIWGYIERRGKPEP
jgi:hypothetical protein